MKKNTSILNLQQNTSQHRFLAAIIINSTIDLSKFPFTVHLFILLCLILEEENILLLFRLHSTKTCVGRGLVYVLYDIIWKRFFFYALLCVFVYLIFLRCYIFNLILFHLWFSSFLWRIYDMFFDLWAHERHKCIRFS